VSDVACPVAGRAPGKGHRLAVMQPYFFPYLGTYQLAHAVDEFVFFDDVNFIKKGYIHRNAVRLNGKAQPFTIPVRDVSQNRHIREHDYTGDWQPFLDLLCRAYRQAPMFDAAYTLIESVARDADDNVARKNALSFTRVFAYLGLPKTWSQASVCALPAELRAQARILALCRAKSATAYVNAGGGRSLYEPAAFEAAGVALRFLACAPVAYPQGTGEFVPNLSMIDLLMHCAPGEIAARLDGCRIEA
jgi:hypothetical protein